MNLWQPLLATAIPGSSRQAFQPHNVEGPIGESLRAIHASPHPVSRQVLDCAALLALVERVDPTLIALTEETSLLAAEDDICAPVPSQAVHLLSQLFTQSKFNDLTAQVCMDLQRTDLRLPPQLLPNAFQAARNHSILRAPIAAVMGKRGHWLASQHNAWHFMADLSTAALHESEQWLHGNLAQRRQFLLQLRQKNTAEARALLEKTLPELPAKERAELVSTLAVGVHADDEPLLERLLHDRAKEVRRAASAVLMRLPCAARHIRMGNRLATLLSPAACASDGKWKSLVEQTLLALPPAPFIARINGEVSSAVGNLPMPLASWDISPPQQALQEWADDGIDLQQPKNWKEGGERAWWLSQLIAHTPMHWWVHYTGCDAATIAGWALRSEWYAAIFNGWREALRTNEDLDWIEALQPYPLPWLHTEISLTHIPLQRRELLWQTQLQQAKGSCAALVLWLEQGFNLAPDETLSPTFSIEVLDLLWHWARVQFDAMDAAGEDDFAHWITQHHLASSLLRHLPRLLCCVDASALLERSLRPTLREPTEQIIELAARCDFIQRTRLTFHSLAKNHQS